MHDIIIRNTSSQQYKYVNISKIPSLSMLCYPRCRRLSQPKHRYQGKFIANHGPLPVIFPSVSARLLHQDGSAANAERNQNPGPLKSHSRLDTSLSEIVNGGHDCGIRIDSHGQLEIVCDEKATSSRRKTALILSRASQSLTQYDFLRVLRVEMSSSFQGGPEKVFPVRHHRSLNRRNSWFLIFSSPSDAKKYQDQACILRSLAAQYALSPYFTELDRPFKTTGKVAAPQFKPYDFTLTSPFQSLSLIAKLSPFDHNLRRAINIHDTLTGTKQTGERSFPVRFWIDFPGRSVLNSEFIKKLLEVDGVARGSAWRLSRNPRDIVPAGHDPGRMSQDDLESSESQSSGSDIGTWQINFKYASDAKRFVRLWHKRRLPQLNGYPPSYLGMVGKAECLF